MLAAPPMQLEPVHCQLQRLGHQPCRNRGSVERTDPPRYRQRLDEDTAWENELLVVVLRRICTLRLLTSGFAVHKIGVSVRLVFCIIVHPDLRRSERALLGRPDAPRATRP